MIRKGYHFRLSKTIVMLTLETPGVKALQDKGILPADREISPGYVIPARAIPRTATPPPAAIETRYVWEGTTAPVFALPIKVTGWSRTNMPFVRLDGKDKVLWFEDGRAYSASL